MIGIETKTLPATNTRPRRIRAFTCNGHSLVVPYDDSKGSVHAHFKAAQALIRAQFFDPRPYETMTFGGTRLGYFFCWTQSTIGEEANSQKDAAQLAGALTGALTNIILASDANDGDSMANAITAAREVLEGDA